MEPVVESEAECYEPFKVAEDRLKVLAKEFRPDAEGLRLLIQKHELDPLFAAAGKVLGHLTFSGKKTIDQRVWNVYKEQIGFFRQCDKLPDYVDCIEPFFRTRVDLMKKLVASVLTANVFSMVFSLKWTSSWATNQNA